jgi:SH3-like domain-containing protein
MKPMGGKQIVMKIRFSIIVLIVIVFATAASAERLAISAPVANIRSGPGVNHDILWKVEKYFPILVIGKSGEWYHFQDFEGDKGWVHQSLVGKIPAIVTNEDACNIRSGPGTNFPILFTVEKGVPFKVLERKGAWVNIEHADGDKGWIHKSLVW